MKIAFIVAVIASSVSSLFARVNLPLQNGSEIELPQIIILSPEGVKMVRPGTNDAVQIKWDNVDLALLAKQSPQLDRLRQQVILLEKKEIVELSDLPDYYAEFLKTPVLVKFNKEFKLSRQASAQIQIDSNNKDRGETPKSLNRSLSLSGRAIEIENLSDETRPSFDSTIEGLFLRISDHRSSRSRRLIRDLVEHQEVYANLLVGLKNLASIYPENYHITQAISALSNFASDPTIRIEDQKRIGEFVQNAREQSSL